MISRLALMIRTAREALGLTQSNVARRLGISQSMYSRFETGRTVPDAYTLGRISRILDLRCDEIFDAVMRDGPKPIR